MKDAIINQHTMVLQTKTPLLSFCINDMIDIQAAIAAAHKTNQIICLMITETAIRFAGYKYLLSFLKEAKEALGKNVLIELDHGKDLTLIKKCIADKFDIVMVDGSFLPFTQNVKLTKSVAKLAHANGVKVEAAIGKVGDIFKDGTKKIGSATNISEAITFFEETHPDYLAVSVGNYHGNSHNKPSLDLPLIEDLSQQISCPLVLHGADFIDSKELQVAIKKGIHKINFGPELRFAYWQTLIAATKTVSSDDPRDAFKLAREMIQKKIEQRIEELL